MSKSVKWKALFVVVLGSAALFSTPKRASGSVFECGFAECLAVTECPNMQEFCALHGCFSGPDHHIIGILSRKKPYANTRQTR